MILPYVDTALLIRTDFRSDRAWLDVCAAARAPVDAGAGLTFSAVVECVDDFQFSGLDVQSLLSSAPQSGEPGFVFLADGQTMGDEEHPIVVVDLYQDRGRTFRVIPKEMWGVENNLSIANMDFCEFANSADSDGIFRGFR